MDQIKIGKFISKLRKDKKMTQQELAKKLNVTDRAISNWEVGRRMPDVSFFKPICDIFDISVNELLSGEKIPDDKKIVKSNETLISAFNQNKKNKSKLFKIIVLLLFVITFSLIILLLTYSKYKNLYPKFDIYYLSVSHSDEIKEKSVYRFKLDDKEYKIWNYGIDSSFLCDNKDNCYPINQALDHKQITIDEFRKFLESQYSFGNINSTVLFDGGTSIYYSDAYSVIFCNTFAGNKDIYVGTSNMYKDLNGAYCGHEANKIKTFTRTYKVLSSKINKNDNELVDILIEQNNNKATVSVDTSSNIVVGKTYEFTFYTFEIFNDTIENIFKYSTLTRIKQTDKSINSQINEKVIVNTFDTEKTELNELEHVSMSIKKGTLSRNGAVIVITDYSGRKYSYGDPFTIEEYKNGKWTELKNICNNCGFNMIAYGPDINGKLELNVYWGRMYGTLKNGKYRIVKDALLNTENMKKKLKRYFISVEFELK